MRERLRHAVEHQADAHTRGEKHREPAQIGIVRDRLITAKADIAKRRDNQQKRKDHHQIGSADQEPIEVLGRKVEHGREDRGGLLWQCNGVKDEDHHSDPRNQKDRVVNIQPERPDLPLDIVLTDFIISIDDIRLALRLGDAVRICIAHNLFPL